MKFVARLAVAVSAVVLPFAAQASLVVNGTFEANVLTSGSANYNVGSTGLTGWNVVGPSGRNVTLTKNGYLGQSTQQLDLSGTSDIAGSGIEQTLSTQVGKKYTVSFDVYTGGTTYNGGVNFLVNGTSFGSNLQGNELGNTTKRYSFEFTATGASTIKFLTHTNGLVSHIDNVSVVASNPVPEPASLAVLGLGALGFFRRRKSA
jgi:hypothetical protein